MATCSRETEQKNWTARLSPAVMALNVSCVPGADVANIEML